MHKLLGSVLLAGFLTGCGGTPSTSPEAQAASAPLTIEGWKAMTGDGKFHPETLERLKHDNESLRTKAGWDKFSREVFLPAVKQRRAGTNG